MRCCQSVAAKTSIVLWVCCCYYLHLVLFAVSVLKKFGCSHAYPCQLRRDIYCSPRKRMHIGDSSSVRGDEQEGENQSLMEALPDECLFEIFRRLPGQGRSSCACVSKRWLNLLSSISKSDIINSDLIDADVDSDEEEEDDSLSRCLEGNKATDLRLLAIAVGTASRGGLGKLSVHGSNSFGGVTDIGLSGIARGCQALKCLSLWDVRVGDKGLTEIARGCQLLEKLHLCNCPLITSKALIAVAEKCPNLSALTLESCSMIGNDGLQAIAKRCTKLEMISIKDCPFIRDQGVASLSSSTSLTKLKLNDLRITDLSLAAISRYSKSIAHLSLINLKNISEKGFWVLGRARRFESLMSLSVTSCLGVTDQSIEAVAKGCPALKHIYLRKCCLVFDKGLVAFSNSAVSLESLHLEELDKITFSGVISALSVCKSKLKNLSLVNCVGLKDTTLGSGELMPTTPCISLGSLSVRNCTGFANVGLTILGKMCPKIRQLDLSGLYGITDEGLLSILKTCEGALVKLSLNGCLNLSDEVITVIVRAHGKTIKNLSLEGCRKLTDVSLVAIAEHCRVLVDLDVSFCAITDSGLAVLSSADQLNLEILCLSGCRKLSDRCIPSLIKMQETLVGLNLMHCKSMSTNTIDVLTESLWRCDIIY